VKIQLAKSTGFCFGVQRAITLALETARSCAHVQMLGDIVHNEDVIRSVAKAGVEKIKRLRPTRTATLLIRAHGASRSTLARARRYGYRIVDATCPMVHEIHTLASRAEKNGYRVIVIGDRKHDEVRGIIGQLSKPAIVIDVSRPLPRARLKRLKKAAIVAQSTQNSDKVLAIVEHLKHIIPDLKFHNTICGPTRTKQSEVKKMPLANDVMIVIGSKDSANTRRLYEISCSLNPRSHWVGSRKDIDPAWFCGAQSVGVIAGASTPDATTQNIIQMLKILNTKHKTLSTKQIQKTRKSKKECFGFRI
jgi:4-hydroxy-3-methylbut-2-enyl diphosphate reductase